VIQPEYTAAAAEAAVKAGSAPVALIVPRGFGEKSHLIGRRRQRPVIQMLKDPSDMVASQVIAGLLQKVAMTSMPDVLAGLGSKYVDRFAGGLTPSNTSGSTAAWTSFAATRASPTAPASPAAERCFPSTPAMSSEKTRTIPWSLSTRRPSA